MQNFNNELIHTVRWQGGSSVLVYMNISYFTRQNTYDLENAHSQVCAHKKGVKMSWCNSKFSSDPPEKFFSKGAAHFFLMVFLSILWNKRRVFFSKTATKFFF